MVHDHESGSWVARAFKLALLVALVMLLAGRVRGYSLTQILTGDTVPPVFSGSSLKSAMSTRGQLVVVDFAAPWCGACREMDSQTWRDPSLQQWIEHNATAVQVNIDRDAGAADIADIRSIPTVVVYRDGRELGRRSGIVPPAELQQWLESLGAR